MADQGKVLITATVPSTAVRGQFVSGAGTFSASLKALGVVYEPPDSGETKTQVQIGGTCLVKAAGTFAAGVSLVSDASGNAEAAGDMVDETITITDDNGAATTGVAVYAHTKDGVNAWLEFVSPTNADGTGTLASGGSKYFIFDSDAAATDGVAVYFDEDGTNANERLLVVSPSGQDLKVTLANGKQVALVHSAGAATTGVAVYFDEDGTNSYERLLFVSPTNADGSATTDDSIRDLTSNAHLSRCISLEAATAAGQLVNAMLV